MLVKDVTIRIERYVDDAVRVVAYTRREPTKGGRRFRPVEGQHTRVILPDGSAEWVDIDTGEVMASSDLDRGAARSRRAFLSRVLAHRWDWFGTLTLNSQMLPAGMGRRSPEVVPYVLELLHQFRSVEPGMQYAVVPELHKDGSFHFHVLLSGITDRQMVPARRGTQYIYQRGRMVHIFAPLQRVLGFTNFSRVTSSLAVGRYMAKYMTKGWVESPGSIRGVGFRRWMVSRGVRPAPSVSLDVDMLRVVGWHPIQIRGASAGAGSVAEPEPDTVDTVERSIWASNCGVWVRYGMISDDWVRSILSRCVDDLPEPTTSGAG
jgi:hypothetical protein